MLTGPQRADQVINFIQKYCVYVKGPNAGKPVRLRDWQKEPILEIYGALDEDGLRETQEAFIVWNKKTGKTTVIAAGLALYHMTIGAEFGAKVFCSASSRDQAKQLFEPCAKMIRMSRPLRDLGFDPDRDVLDYKHRIFYPRMDSELRAVAAEAGTLHGENPSFLISDEIHALRNRDALDALELGMGTWEEPLSFKISNHGDLDASPVYWEEKARAVKWLAKPKAERDRSYYASIYELDPAINDNDALKEGSHWEDVNPHLGDFMSWKYFRNIIKGAREMPSKRVNVLRLNLGRPVQSETAWLNLGEWDACEFAPRRTEGLTDELTDYELLAKDLEGRECFMGCDLSSTLDITAQAYLFPEEDGGFTLLERLWLPKDNIRDLERQCEVPLQKWAEDGYITLTPGPVVDYDMIEADIIANSKRWRIRQNAMCDHNAESMSQHLNKAGVQTVYVTQNIPTLNEPSKELESLIKTGKLRHLVNPATRWMASVVTIISDTNGDFRPVKPKKRAEGKRVDVIQSIVFALYCWQHAPAPLTASSVSFG